MSHKNKKGNMQLFDLNSIYLESSYNPPQHYMRTDEDEFRENLSTFPWATFRKKKAAVKIHTLLNVQGSIPTLIFVTPGSVHDVNMMYAVS